MKHINRRKNGGSMLIEPLENAYEDLNDGDEYVYLGKHNRVLNKGSERTDDNRVGRVVWMHNVKDNYKVVATFDTFNYIQYKEYLVDFKGLIENVLRSLITVTQYPQNSIWERLRKSERILFE